MKPVFVAASMLMLSVFAGSIYSAGDSSQKKQPVSRKDAIFGLHFDFHANQYDREIGANISEDNIRELMEKVQPDFVQYDCKGHAGYTSYPTKVGTPSPGIIKDALPIWRKVTDEYGVKLFIHYSGLYDAVAVQQHPEWARIDENGKPDDMATSTFGPYVDELLIPQLREVASMYRLDGMWVDGECWGAKLDYSTAALAAWKKETGFDNAPRSHNEPNWREWKDFNRRQFETYLCHWVDELHKTHPNLEVTSNWAYSSMMPKPVLAKLDYLSGDYQPLKSLNSARFEARYLSSVGDPWELMAWGFNSGRGVSHTYKNAIQLQQEASVVLMQGGAFQIYYLPTRPGFICDEIINNAASAAKFCRDRQSVCRKNTSVPQVALLFSTETMADKSDTPYSVVNTDEISGALQSLLESQFSVDILPEFKLQPQLSKYPLVVIPDDYQLTDSFKKALTKYVKDGGNLLLLGQRCARLFEPMLGVEFVGEPTQVSTELFTKYGIVNENGIWQKVKPVSAEALAFRYPFNDPNRDGEVAATFNVYGKGKVAAIYGPVCINYSHTHHPYLRKFIAEMARKLFANPIVEVDSPPCVEVALRTTKDGKLSVHLLNTSNMQESDDRIAFDFIPSVGPIEIKLKVTEKPESVRWVPSGGRVKWNWKDGVLTARIPKLEIYGILVVD